MTRHTRAHQPSPTQPSSSPPPNPPVVDPGPERDLNGRIHGLHRHRHHVGRRVPRPQQAVAALVRGKLPHLLLSRAPIGGRPRRRGGGEASPQRWLAQAPRASSERREHPTCLWVVRFKACGELVALLRHSVENMNQTFFVHTSQASDEGCTHTPKRSFGTLILSRV
jgi:hypothetical protein